VIDLVAFDADDTLWHNEPLYSATASRFRDLLAAYHSADWIDQRLYETEIRNLRHYGYGIKSFTLSMIETAIELTEGRIRGPEVAEILGYGKEMLEAPVRLLEGAEETVRELASSYRLIVVTKGDLLDQESKVARSGLGDCFSGIEIVSEKNSSTYRQICAHNSVDPERLVMVGDSLRSDILPAVEAGCHAIHIPYETPWQHEVVSDDVVERYEFQIAGDLRGVPGLIGNLRAGGD
jgi:putative hydrolase of the HAD superfamily